MKHLVSIVRYEEPGSSLSKAVELSGGLNHISSGTKVFIKPNIVFWTSAVPFPKWGVITTSRVVEDLVDFLKNRGINDISIGEGTVMRSPKDRQTVSDAFQALGYGTLKKRYGVKLIDMFDRPFEKAELSKGVELAFNTDILHADLVVNLPVLKTHAQTVVSLGIKNLKGTIDLASRKRCHSPDPQRDLNFMISKLADEMPPIFTVIDGIYTNERGPGFDGRAHRKNILIASSDVLSADLVGTRVLGHQPSDVPHLVQAAKTRGQPLDLTDIDVVGEQIDKVASYHRYEFPYTQDGGLPLPMAKMGISGLCYRKYDSTLCTYCSALNGALLLAIARAWKGEPWDDVEVLTGKAMQPTPGRKKTILLGKCMYEAHKDNPDIEEMFAVKGCPPQPKQAVKAFHAAGIPIESSIVEDLDRYPGIFMERYREKPGFEEGFFEVS